MTAEILGAYAFIGACFAIAFVSVLLPRYDSAARGTSIGFRLLAFPGALLLWPLLLLKLRSRA